MRLTRIATQPAMQAKLHNAASLKDLLICNNIDWCRILTYWNQSPLKQIQNDGQHSHSQDLSREIQQRRDSQRRDCPVGKSDQGTNQQESAQKESRLESHNNCCLRDKSSIQELLQSSSVTDLPQSGTQSSICHHPVPGRDEQRESVCGHILSKQPPNANLFGHSSKVTTQQWQQSISFHLMSRAVASERISKGNSLLEKNCLNFRRGSNWQQVSNHLRLLFNLLGACQWLIWCEMGILACGAHNSFERIEMWFSSLWGCDNARQDVIHIILRTENHWSDDFNQGCW